MSQQQMSELAGRVIARLGQDRASAVVWLPGNYPKALLVVAGPAGIIVTGLRWPVYGPGRPTRVFACRVDETRPPYAAMAEDGLRAILSAYEGDRDVTLMNTGVFPEHATRRALRLYSLDKAVVQVVPGVLAPGKIIV